MMFFKKIEWKENGNCESLLGQAIIENKVVLLTGIPPETELKDFYLDLLSKIDLGDVIVNYEDHVTGEMTSNKWLGIKYVQKIADQSLRFSNENHPLHTDGAYVDFPFDVCFLFCVKQAETGGQTIFLDSTVLLHALKKTNISLLRRLENIPVAFQKDRNSVKKLPVITYDENGEAVLNWNFRRISQTNDKEAMSLIMEFKGFLESGIGTGLLEVLTLQRGDAVFFHDKKVLHGRTAFFGDRFLLKGAISLKPQLQFANKN